MGGEKKGVQPGGRATVSSLFSSLLVASLVCTYHDGLAGLAIVVLLAVQGLRGWVGGEGEWMCERGAGVERGRHEAGPVRRARPAISILSLSLRSKLTRAWARVTASSRTIRKANREKRMVDESGE